MTSKVLGVPPPLPENADDWILQTSKEPSINDHVQDIHARLLRSEKANLYRGYLNAVYDEQAVEGSLAADNIESARIIREHAVKVDSGHPLGREKLATIAKALGVILRRYHFSRKERRQMIDGQVVPGDNGD